MVLRSFELYIINFIFVSKLYIRLLITEPPEHQGFTLHNKISVLLPPLLALFVDYCINANFFPEYVRKPIM